MAMKRAIFIFLLLGLASQAGERIEPLLRDGVAYSVPFAAGERLVYEVNWKPFFFIPAFKAGELSLQVEQSRYQQKDAYKLSAWALSSGALPGIAGLSIRNYFESIIDRENFRSYRLFKQTRQGERKRDMEILFDYKLDRTRLYEVDAAVEPPQEIRDETIPGIPGPLNDVLSVFYVARLRDISVGDRYLIYLSDNGKHEQVQVRVERKEKVHTPIGQFDALKITTVGGLFKGGGDFRIWYSEDDWRVPVKFEADVRFGKVYGQLIRMQTQGISRGRIRTSS